MNENTELLLRLGRGLRELGKQLKKRRDKIKQLVSQGCSYDSPELIQQVKEYQLLKGQFASLEAQFKDAKRQKDGDV